MKKRVWAVMLLLVLAFTISAEAVEPRAASSPELLFDGTTAECSVTCLGDKTQDSLRVTLTLYQGSTYVDSWSKSGTRKVSLSGKCGVESGKSYTLTLSWSINGVTQPSASVTRTCP